MRNPGLIILWVFLGLLIYWFAARIIGTFRKPTRSTIRLHGEGDEGDIDEPVEVIDTSGGPIKPGHHRRALSNRCQVWASAAAPKETSNRSHQMLTLGYFGQSTSAGSG